MQVMQQSVSAQRIAQRIEELAACSTTVRGVTRLSFTKESETANELVSQWMREAGMIVRRDELGNLIGRYEGTQPDAPALLIGSHLDSVVEAGKYDGILGVLSGIEVVQTLHEHQYRPRHPIEVIGFCDEEGTRFHTTLLGSKALSGDLRAEDLQAKDEQGITVAAAMQELGLEPSRYHLAARDPKTILGYIELHIEQGPVLEQEMQACGAVSGIAGAARYHFRVEGNAGHAGTVPISMRKDALVGTSEMILAMEKAAQKYQNLVVTVGKLSVAPGASNVIPGVVEGTLDIRHIEDQTKKMALADILEECRRILARRGLVGEFSQIMDSPAVACSQRFINEIETVLAESGMKPIQIVSGAGHDAMAVASITDIGMIFVRCRDGVSHHPDEFVTVADMQAGASVLLNVVLRLT
ncbi:allantoate amidohydrolase [Brevibacillus reuszeri]|uniref:allantoate amidohydrolase n=1 Tax=Brevibacillus reuszeri TaxID=54915 RepID=UPI000CCC0F64|nr:allantoate amidohydrolase [Brevibacillus reuszeri]